MKITLIHNPSAGGDQPSDNDLIDLIRRAGHDVVYRSFPVAEWQQVLEEASDLVAIAGGDGVVGEVAKHLLGRPIPFTILPLGTANNIAATLGLAKRPLAQLIAGWERAPCRRFDVGFVRSPWGSSHFIEGVGLGAFTDTMARLDARKNVDISHHEDADKKIQSVQEIMAIRLEGAAAHRLDLMLDGREISGDYVMLEAMNICRIGPNLCLAPAADPGDGLLDVVLVAEEHRPEVHRYLSDQTTGENFPVLPIFHVRQLRIRCEPLRLRIDDDVHPAPDEPLPQAPMIIEAGIHEQSLEVFLPEEPTG